MNESIFRAENFTDNRGSIHFFNKLDLNEIKRVYILEHPSTDIIRAWQGHKYENKWFLVISGSFKIVIVQPDNWITPSDTLSCREWHLAASPFQILHIPGGNATGLKAEEENSKIMVFSNSSLNESQNDDYRFEKDKWYSW